MCRYMDYMFINNNNFRLPFQFDFFKSEAETKLPLSGQGLHMKRNN